MNNINKEDPLVSIIVITYNSAEFVLETLESAKNQTYTNLELIISDDCSKDNTIDICREWVELNAGRFVRTEIITVETNTGISPNCNRGFKAAQGKWLKPIAGDDILAINCIEYFILETINYPEYHFFFSDIEIFGDGEAKQKRVSVRRWMDNALNRFESIKNSESLYKHLLVQNIICAPSSFVLKKAFQEVGGFDEEIKLIEDYPFWLKIAKQNYQIKSTRDQLVKYRVNSSSVQTSISYNLALELFRQKYVFRNFLSKFIIPRINQLKPNNKDFIYCKILKFTAFPQRIVWNLKLKFGI